MAQLAQDQATAMAYKIADVTTRTGIGRTTLFNLIRDGRLRAVKVGSRTLIRADDLADFLASLPDARGGKAA
ncbi:MAG: helix-turn-helix domain-containing protein [Hyphomicrobiales bacterium]|nr:helix-turn-helix domain-containing protein [Hyphomicrobiales bacterium]